MPTSPRTQIPYPNENSDPWTDQFTEMVNAIDVSIYAQREDRNSLVSGGGTFTFNSTSGVLAWSAAIDIFAPVTGMLWRVAAGNVTLTDGQCFYITLARAPQTIVVCSPTVGTTVPNDVSGDSQLIVGWRHGTIVHFRNGYAIHNGSSIQIFDSEPAVSGTPGGSSGDAQVNNGGSLAGVSPGTVGNVFTSTGSAWVSAAPTGGGGAIGYGVYASRPAAGTTGALYIATDSPTTYVDDGAAWHPWVNGVVCTAPPAAASFTAVNQGTSTLTDSVGHLLATDTANAASNDRHLFVKSLAAGAWTLEVGFWPGFQVYSGPGPIFGFIRRDSGTGKFITYAIYFASGAIHFAQEKWTNVTTPSASYNDDSITYPNGVFEFKSVQWMRIVDDGVTNVTVYMSANGKDWLPLAAPHGRTDFMTPDQYGIEIQGFGGSSASDPQVISRIFHWKKT